MIWKLFLATTSLLLALTSAGSANCSNTNYFNHNYLDILASLSNREKDRVVSRISSLSKATPDAVYHRVYTLIKEDYYDGTYNHQDWSRWEHRYDGKLATFQDAHKAIETMLLSLGDRYTRFLDTDAFDDEKQQIESRLCGIGVQIGLDPDTHKVIVVAPIEDTPAYRAGVKAMDEMVRINGKSTKGFTVEDAAKHIRGQINTPVELVLGRDGKEIKVKVMRAEITILAVPTAVMLDKDMGYIRLSSFISQQATREMIKALDKLSSARGIILDLRDNPGGLLNNAIDISNLFIDKGNIVSTVDRDGYKTPASSDGHPIYRKPLVVLINKGSASASEICSGALHDNNRAILVGQQTFGKGLVQGINKLDDGSGVNVTIARYLTPNDTDIHKKGITPDVRVDLSSRDLELHKGPWWSERQDDYVRTMPPHADGKDVQLHSAMEVLQKCILQDNNQQKGQLAHQPNDVK